MGTLIVKVVKVQFDVQSPHVQEKPGFKGVKQPSFKKDFPTSLCETCPPLLGVRREIPGLEQKKT